MTKDKGKDPIFTQNLIKSLLDNGSMILLRLEFILKFKILTPLNHKDKNILMINISYLISLVLDFKIQFKYSNKAWKK